MTQHMTKQLSESLEITDILEDNMNTNFSKYGDDRKLNNLCVTICQKINKYIRDYNILDVSIVTYFMNFLTYDRSLYYDKKPILALKTDRFKLDEIIATLSLMAEYIKLHELGDIVETALCSYNNVAFFIKLYSEQNIQLPMHILEESCKKKLCNNIKSIYTYFPNMISEDDVNYIISNDVYNGDAHLIYELLGFKYTITKDSLKKLMINNCFDNDQTLKLFKIIILTGIQIDEDILEYACLYKKYSIMDFLLSNDIKPNERCFNNILRHPISSSNSFDKESCLTLLIKYGYDMTYTNFLDATRAKLTIKNLEKYNFKITQEFMEICSEIGFYPNYGSINLTPDSICIENECRRVGNIEKIKKLVGMGCVVSSKALENACEHRNNLPTLRYLIQCGATITPKAVINMAIASGNSGMILISQEYSNQEQKREQKRCQEKQQNSTVSISIERQNDKDHKNGSDIFYVDYSDEEEPNSDSTNDDLMDDDVSHVAIDTNDDHNTTKIAEIPIQNTYNLANVQLIQFQTVVIPILLKKSFSIPEKQNINYVDFRKKIFDYIVINKLFNSQNQKNIFMLDKKLADLSNIKKDTYINFNDFDRFISKLIKVK